MLRSTDRIRTTHVGSLARPPALLDLMRAAAQGRPVDPTDLGTAEGQAVAEVVARQHAAGLVGRENVVASADCGFSSQATYTPEIHPTIVWAKFEALAEGARLAAARLW
jgi:methionine synthase II (cobalamin-independent)